MLAMEGAKVAIIDLNGDAAKAVAAASHSPKTARTATRLATSLLLAAIL